MRLGQYCADTDKPYLYQTYDQMRRVFEKRKPDKLYCSYFWGRKVEKREYVYQALPEFGASLYGNMKGYLPKVLEREIYAVMVVYDSRKPFKLFRYLSAREVFYHSLKVRLENGVEANWRNFETQFEDGDGKWVGESVRRIRVDETECKAETEE